MLREPAVRENGYSDSPTCSELKWEMIYILAHNCFAHHKFT